MICCLSVGLFHACHRHYWTNFVQFSAGDKDYFGAENRLFTHCYPRDIKCSIYWLSCNRMLVTNNKNKNDFISNVALLQSFYSIFVTLLNQQLVFSTITPLISLLVCQRSTFDVNAQKMTSSSKITLVQLIWSNQPQVEIRSIAMDKLSDRLFWFPGILVQQDIRNYYSRLSHKLNYTGCKS